MGYVLAAIAFSVALAVAIVARRMQQRTVRRLIDVVEHLGEAAPGRPRGDLAMARLERSVQRVRERDDRVQRAELRLELALSEMTQGAVVCDEQGIVVFRNAYAQSFVGARHGGRPGEHAGLEHADRGIRRVERVEHDTAGATLRERLLLLVDEQALHRERHQHAEQ